MDILYNSYNIDNLEMINYIVPIIDVLCPVGYSPNGKYTNKYFITCLIDFLNTSVSWRKYNGFSGFPINGKYLNSIHHKYIKNGVYEAINKALLEKYLKIDKELKLTVQIIDSSFVANKQGIHNLQDKPKKKKVKKRINKTKSIKKTIKHSLIKPIKNSHITYEMIPIKNPNRILKTKSTRKNIKKIKYNNRIK